MKLLLVIAKNQLCGLKTAKIRLVAQRRKIFAQVIEVEAILCLLELHNFILHLLNQ